VYGEYEGVVQSTDLAAALARAYGPADMAILTGHGTLVTAHSPALALLRAQCFEHRSRKAWEVKALGLPGVPLLDDVAQKVSEGADVYADLLLENYARHWLATDPDALVDDLTP
jgi:ribulose-5-phosphate 4-epimerase/fuculose-1-phosphate aldolase